MEEKCAWIKIYHHLYFDEPCFIGFCNFGIYIIDLRSNGQSYYHHSQYKKTITLMQLLMCYIGTVENSMRKYNIIYHEDEDIDEDIYFESTLPNKIDRHIININYDDIPKSARDQLRQIGFISTPFAIMIANYLIDKICSSFQEKI